MNNHCKQHHHGGCHGKGHHHKGEGDCNFESKDRAWLEAHRDHLKERLAKIENALENK